MKKTKRKMGSHKDTHKPKIHLLPEEAIIAAAYAFGYGESKYKRFNYRSGIYYTKLTDSLIRHTIAFTNGETYDKESKLPHTFHMIANSMMLEYMRFHYPELDDRYIKNKRKKK